MSENRKLPARHDEQVPAENDPEARLPAPPGTTGGLIKQGLSRFWAKLGTGTTDDNTKLVQSQQRYVDAYGKLADTAYDTKRKVDRLRHDLPSQLDADRAQHADMIEAAEHEIALKKAKRAAELAAFKANDERERMTRDLQFMTDQADKRKLLQHAARNEIDAKVQRDIRVRTAPLEIERAITAFQTGDFAELNKFMTAKKGYEENLREYQTTPAPSQTTLEQRLDILKQMIAKAKAENWSAEARVKLQDEFDAVNNELETAHARKTIP